MSSSSDFEKPVVKPKIKIGPRSKVKRTSGFSAEDGISFVPLIRKGNLSSKDDGESSASVVLISDDNDSPNASDTESGVRVWKTETLKSALPGDSRLPPAGPYASSSLSNGTAKAQGKRPSVSTRMKRYVIGDDEREEEENTEIFNETPPGEQDAGAEDEKPCRSLNNFVIFDRNAGNEIVDLRDLFEDDVYFSISGDVEPINVGDMNDDEDDDDAFDDDDQDNGTDADGECVGQNVSGSSRSSIVAMGGAACTGRPGSFKQRIYLSAIMNYETFLSAKGDTEIWVLTSFAWYKLLLPHPGYAHLYAPLFKTVFMAHQALTIAKSEPSLSMTQYIKRIKETNSEVIDSMTPITDSDFRNNRDSVILEIEACADAGDFENILFTPLIMAICRTSNVSAKKERSGRSGIASSSAPRRVVKKLDDTKQENPACITTLVASIAKDLYAQHLVSVSHFLKPSADGTAGATSEGESGTSKPALSNTADDTWKKKYAGEAKRNKIHVEQDLGKVSVPDLLRGGVALQQFKVDRIKGVEDSCIPNMERGKCHYREVSVAPVSKPEVDGKDSSSVNIRLGDTVMISVQRPTTENALETLWDAEHVSESSGMNDGPVAGPFARIYRVTSIFFSTATQSWLFHGQLMLPGRDTILEEVAFSNEWYLIDQCRTCPLYNLCGKIDISFIGTREEIDPFKVVADRTMICRFWYDTASAMFEDVNKHSAISATHAPGLCQSCRSKDSENVIKVGRTIAGSKTVLVEDKITQTSRQISCSEYVSTVTVGGIEYHERDIIYFPSQYADQPFEIGYITKFDGDFSAKRDKMIVHDTKAEVRILKRMLVLPPGHRPQVKNSEYNDGRHLYWTPLIMEISVTMFRGKCWVVHPEEVLGRLNVYKDSDVNAFYAQYEAMKVYPTEQRDWAEVKPYREMTPEEEMAAEDEDERMPMEPYCKICKRERRHHENVLAQFLKAETVPPANRTSSNAESFMCGRQPLRALDLFSGCGGLTQGMDQSGIVKTKWAVEFMPSAGITFSKNHPEAQVYNQCSNLLLDSAIKNNAGIPTKPLINKFNQKELPPMPQPGDVDFIYCGPPCQGFSRCNRFLKADDIKTSLIANALSYVDFYRPSYFLLENVRGLLDYRLGGVQLGKGRIGGGIKMGMLKFIVRVLTTMGYQTRFYVLQAGNYGLAQSRRRLFVWACKRGCSLPGIPLPSTTFPKSNQTNINFPNGTVYAPLSHLKGNAPHHAITVEDAISDLPRFEFANPAIKYPEPDPDAKNREWPVYHTVYGSAPGLTQEEIARAYVGHMAMSYTNPPASEFQRLRRRKQQVCIPGTEDGYDQLVGTLHNHVSRKFDAMNVERICRVEMKPGMDHRSLPQDLKPWCLSSKDSAAARNNGWKGLFGRLDPKGCFGTALTEMSPMGKSGTVLLYDQRRVLSVRECARAQGFADTFKLYSQDELRLNDMHRQVGNAVPPPLAYALSLKLREALLKDHVRNTPDSSLLPGFIGNDDDSEDGIPGNLYVDVICSAMPVAITSVDASSTDVVMAGESD
ncbi:hypothetical protein GGI15_000236 [Coemansia interrupta]|uniref:Cytosine-specific methyltransferase n=1 Tax=Coemansia interrupta TaxID=1126814 RepID=A0A9W8HKI9_9FUNG|nr:hypothetical protein GGI15_000236 [Coemansia interrupta]